MTRKEPQFGDDLQQPIDTSAANQTVQHEASPSSENDHKTSKNWLLWIFVTASLIASFGMAFFGLEEAGKYQAALTKAQEQSEALQVTLERLDQTQVRGIGELAQSDAQMRKMVVDVERRIQSEFTDRLKLMQSKVAGQSEELESTKAAVKKLKRNVDETQAALIVSTKQISETKQLASEIETKFTVSNKTIADNSQIVEKLSNGIKFRESEVDEALALMGEQLSGVRARLDRLSQIRDAVVELSSNVKKLNMQSASVERYMKEIEVTQAAIEQTIVGLEEAAASSESELAQLLQKHNNLANDTISSLAIDNLKKEQVGLQNQLNEQNDLLQSVNSSRKILNKRLIDLDARILVLTPKGQ